MHNYGNLSNISMVRGVINKMNNSTLTVDRILDYCDEPLLFTARDEFDTLYLAMLTQDEAPQYVAIKISNHRLCEFENGKIDLRSIYKNPENEGCYFQLTIDNDKLLSTLGPNVITEKDLPEEGYYLTGNEHELVTVNIPRKDKTLFQSIIHRFGWVAM